MEAWKDAPSQFVGRPRVPKYQDTTKGRFLLTDDVQAISRRARARGILMPAGLNIEIQTLHQRIKHARIVPRIGF